jgi:Holliday junction resolvasome RuvABC DNA-binding subunit
MSKNKKFKKTGIEKLRILLDDPSTDKLHSKDEKYLIILREQLKANSKENVIIKKYTERVGETEADDSLQPRVIIHPRKEKIIPEISKIEFIEKTEEVTPIFEEVNTEEKDKEDLIEIDKVEVKEPEFLEVKPKETIKKQNEVEIEKPLEEELPVWQPVELEKKDELFVEVEKVEERKFEIYCPRCNDTVHADYKFCQTCGYNLKEEKGEKQKDIDWEQQEGKRTITEAEPKEIIAQEEEPPINEEEPVLEKTEIYSPKDQEKINNLKELENIDDATAKDLFDHGFTSIDVLTIATVKDISKIPGINKKLAKKIKKELEKKSGEVKVYKSPDVDVTSELELTEKQVEGLEDKGITLLEKISAFAELNSVDDKSAVMLYDYGFKTVDSLKNATVKDLSKIKGIKKKKAKIIIAEIEKIILESSEPKTIDIKDTTEGEISKEQIEEKKPFLEEKVSTVELNSETAEWEPVEEEIDLQEGEVGKFDEESLRKKIEVFKEIESIDNKIAILLYDNGYPSVESLKETTIKDLIKIKGIRKKVAKEIKKEVKRHIDKINSKNESYEKIEDNPYINDDIEKPEEEEWISFDEFSEEKETEGYSKNDYILYEKEITTKSGNHRIVRFFSRGKPDDAHPIEIPEGFEVIENKKTGVPYLRRKK